MRRSVSGPLAPSTSDPRALPTRPLGSGPPLRTPWDNVEPMTTSARWWAGTVHPDAMKRQPPRVDIAQLTAGLRKLRRIQVARLPVALLDLCLFFPEHLVGWGWKRYLRLVPRSSPGVRRGSSTARSSSTVARP